MKICIPFLMDCGWGKHPGLLVLTEQNIFFFFLMAVGHGNCVRPRRFYLFIYLFFIIICGKKFKHQKDIQMEQKTSALTCRASEA